MKKEIKILLIAMLTAKLLLAQQTLGKTLRLNNVNREYIVYIPASYNSSVAVPLMLHFHGYEMTATDQMFLTGMRAVADTAGFIIVYPQGLFLRGENTFHWNVGSWTTGSTSDDIGFVKTMLDSLAVNYKIDLDRVYSCGFSNGGYFSFELACKLSNRIAAIGSVGGTMSAATFNACNPSHATPVVTIHGTADVVVDYNGFFPPGSKPIADVNTYWSKYNKTLVTPIISRLPDINSTDGSTVELSLYDKSINCPPVEHYKVIGGGHTWPGIWGNRDINSSEVIWRFVSRYNMKELIKCGNATSTIENSSQVNYKAYPNPLGNQLTIKTDFTNVKQYKIYNILGKLMITGQLTSDVNTIDLSSLPPNIYIFRTDNQSIKLIKTE